MNPTKLNLGCGWEKLSTCLNIDISEEVNPDVVHDLANGLQFLEDNSIEYIFSSHALEHVKPDGYNFLIREMFRVSKNGAIWELELPFDNINNRTNNEHYRTYAWNSFSQYYTRNQKRSYYKNGALIPLHKEVNIIEKIFFNVFPFLKHQVEFKFKVVKGEDKNV